MAAEAPPCPGSLVAVGQKYREDRGRQYAALLSYYGFISMFPLLLAFVSILSVLLKDSRPSATRSSTGSSAGSP